MIDRAIDDKLRAPEAGVPDRQRRASIGRHG
jgi:hypothetical protein